MIRVKASKQKIVGLTWTAGRIQSHESRNETEQVPGTINGNKFHVLFSDDTFRGRRNRALSTDSHLGQRDDAFFIGRLMSKR